jgi:superfamily I DNA and/or RNA helicase
MPRDRNEGRILTVHGAQGKEWENVLLSVVDTDKKWFTDSRYAKSRGLFLLNTAVSRAKKRLIIFGNYHYWKKQHGQLIKGLLDVAEEWRML